MSKPVANKKPCRFRVQQDRLNLSFPAVQGTPQCIKSIGASVFLANYTPGVKLFRKKIPAPTEYATAGLICSRPARVGLGQQQTSISKCLGKKSRRRFACMRKKHRQSYLVSGAAKRRPCDILPEYQTCARSRARSLPCSTGKNRQARRHAQIERRRQSDGAARPRSAPIFDGVDVVSVPVSPHDGEKLFLPRGSLDKARPTGLHDKDKLL